MPLYDHSYRRHEGRRSSRFQRSLALARSSARLLLKRRSFLLLLALSWSPAVVRAAQIYVARQFPQAPDFFTVSAATWREFLGGQVQFLPVVLVSLYTGASAIASDVASGALVVFLSKPVSRFDYVLGRLMPVAAAIAFITLVPALALLLLQVSLAPGLDWISEAPHLPLSIVGYSLFLSLYFSITVLAVSSLCRSGRVAGAGFAALAFGSNFVARAALAGEPPGFLSMTKAAIEAGYWFFAEPSVEGASISVAVMSFTMLLALFVLDRRLRSKEIVS
jgi:ABC-2 type transport system permease protein